MLYILIGNDRYEIAEKTKEITSEFENAQFINRDADSFLINEINFFAQSRGLFDEITICVVDGILANDLFEKEVNEIFPTLMENKNIFIFRDEKLSKVYDAFIKKHPKVLYKFELKKEKEMGDNFAITNAFANRDKQKTWILLRDAFENKRVAEEINGTLLWKVRTLYTTHNKFTKFTKDELLKISKNLITLYHNAHLGKVDYETGLESLVIKSL